MAWRELSRCTSTFVRLRKLTPVLSTWPSCPGTPNCALICRSRSNVRSIGVANGWAYAAEAGVIPCSGMSIAIVARPREAIVSETSKASVRLRGKPCTKMATGQPFAGLGAIFGTMRMSGMSMAVPAAGTGLKRVRLRLAGSRPGTGDAPAACQAVVKTVGRGRRSRHCEAIVDVQGAGVDVGESRKSDERRVRAGGEKPE